LDKALEDSLFRFGALKFWWQNTKRLARKPNLILVLLTIGLNSLCQNTDNINLQQKIEELAETSASEPDLSDMEMQLIESADHPLNLNTAAPEELQRIPFLSEKQIINLRSYLENYGEILSVYELKFIDGFDSATISMILPYVSVDQINARHPVKVKELFTRGRISILSRYQQILQKQQGYMVSDSMLKANPNSGYPGSSQKYFFRITYTFYDRISAGFIGEKDPGEQFFKGNQSQGMDFYSGYIALKNTGMLRALVIGNFNVEFGQGLTLGSTISFGSQPSSGNLRRFARGISPSLSTNESNYLRGFATCIKFHNLAVSAFYSNHKRDANLLTKDSLEETNLAFSSFQETGYHRLPGEFAGKNAVREIVYGGNINYSGKHFMAGITGFRSQWNADNEPAKKPYNHFIFSGRSNINLGMDIQLLFRTIYGFGEISASINGGIAFLAGIQVSPDPNIKFSVIYRDYKPGYQNLFCNAVGQNTHNSNESGMLFNISSRFSRKVGLYAYIEVFRTPWLKYRKTLLSAGSDISIQLDFTPSKTVTMFLQYRPRFGQADQPGTQTIKSWDNISKRSLRYQAGWLINPLLTLTNRFDVIECSAENRKSEYGFLISQDMDLKFRKAPLELFMRYALFQTDSYESAIYAYEKDVLYGYSVPALDGCGLRVIMLAVWKPFRFLECWFRIGHTWYSDREVIGSGLDAINGNNKSEIKIQVIVKI
jgi:hypothetical protein